MRDPNGRAYNRTAHLAERRKMMQLWADYPGKQKTGAEVIPLHGKALAICLVKLLVSRIVKRA